MVGFIGTSITITISYITTHNQWLPKTRPNPYLTTSVFSSSVTGFLLIYESVISSASVVRWLTLHSWTLNYWTAFWTHECIVSYNWGEPKRDHHLEQFVCYYLCFVRCYETCLATCYPATDVLPLLTLLKVCGVTPVHFRIPKEHPFAHRKVTSCPWA
jgi:hypothetical protein